MRMEIALKIASLRSLSILVLFVCCQPSGFAETIFDGKIVGLERPTAWDSYPVHLYDGIAHRIWWCGQDEDVVDAIIYSETNGSLSIVSRWTLPELVIQRSQVPWADHHICDPTVIAGSFYYLGADYELALYFTADQDSGINNTVGAAFGNFGDVWKVIDYPVLDPDFPFNNSYGVGASTAFYDTSGTLNSVYQDTTHFDYADSIRQKSSQDGLVFFPTPSLETSIGGLGHPQQLKAPDIAYSPLHSSYFMVTQQRDAWGLFDGKVQIHQSAVGGGLSGGWTLVGEFDRSSTGNAKNNNPGLARNISSTLFIDHEGWAHILFGSGSTDVLTWDISKV